MAYYNVRGNNEGVSIDHHGLIMEWMDNHDVNVYTPNGTRETHQMAIILTIHL